MVIVVNTPRPSEAEELRAEFGHAWDIWRELLPGGRHGDWIAERLTQPAAGHRLRASTIPTLAELLREEP